jgi:hypothetical protein
VTRIDTSPVLFIIVDGEEVYEAIEDDELWNELCTLYEESLLPAEAATNVH